MIWDILGIIAGFAAVMLLLSVIVTALAQATQHLLHLRGRNLQWGLRLLLGTLGTKKLGPISIDNAVARIMQSPMPGDDTEKPPSRRSFAGWTLGEGRTWIEAKDLPRFLKRAKLNLGKETIEEIADDFVDLEHALSRRFRVTMRYWSLAWGFLIAFYFQVDTPQLLHDLSTDPQLRASYAALVDSVARMNLLLPEDSYVQVSDEALLVLQERHPDLREQIEEASGIGQDRSDIIAELRLVLTDARAHRDEVLLEYAILLDDLHRKRFAEAVELARSGVAELARFDITPWREGWSFYTRFGGWFGVVITSILLTFGAPFWYNVLRNAVSLRDVSGSRDR